jgi:hypothetical protein
MTEDPGRGVSEGGRGRAVQNVEKPKTRRGFSTNRGRERDVWGKAGATVWLFHEMPAAAGLRVQVAEEPGLVLLTCL